MHCSFLPRVRDLRRRNGQTKTVLSIICCALESAALLPLANFPEGTPIIDLSIYYDGGSHFWRCLGGATSVIRVDVSTHSLDQTMSAEAFLNERWRAKDVWLRSKVETRSDAMPAN